MCECGSLSFFAERQRREKKRGRKDVLLAPASRLRISLLLLLSSLHHSSCILSVRKDHTLTHQKRETSEEKIAFSCLSHQTNLLWFFIPLSIPSSYTDTPAFNHLTQVAIRCVFQCESISSFNMATHSPPSGHKTRHKHEATERTCCRRSRRCLSLCQGAGCLLLHVFLVIAIMPQVCCCLFHALTLISNT